MCETQPKSAGQVFWFSVMLQDIPLTYPVLKTKMGYAAGIYQRGVNRGASKHIQE